jgi:hypothetical protein
MVKRKWRQKLYQSFEDRTKNGMIKIKWRLKIVL